MRIIITGGHLSPMLAVIDKLPKDSEILVIGRKHAMEGDNSLSLEFQSLSSKNIKFKGITTGRMQRKITKYTFPSLFKFPYGFFQAFSILKKFRPDVVLSFGSYISLPVTISAFFSNIPVVIHEQTFRAGFSNKIAAKFAKRVCISWSASLDYFPLKKTVLTGNPLRKEFFLGGKSELLNFSDKNKSIIYITGGSLGSHAINVLVQGCLEKILKKYNVLHQTGDAEKFDDFKRLSKLRESLDEKLKKSYALTKFVNPDEVYSVMAGADLVISRSGINTVSELAYLKKPSILIPLPFSQNNEQIENANFLKNLGLGEVFNQGKNSEEFFNLIESIMSNLDNYKKNLKETDKLFIIDSAEKIVNEVQKFALDKKKKDGPLLAEDSFSHNN